jgi:D-3-phosphoglycerate dehydrogenase
MKNLKVVITDHGFNDLHQEERILAEAGCALSVAQAKTPAEVIQAAAGANGLLVQWAPVNAEVIQTLAHCRIIVRYGIGTDNVDLAAAWRANIPVCNVPDYGIEEVADHAMALALALARQLPLIDRRLRAGGWKLTPDATMPPFNEMTFATAGFGRIARAVHERARGFKFQLVASDPFVSEEQFGGSGVIKVQNEELFASADILSLHLPLTQETRHFVNAPRLAAMKPHAILINTARGPLVDTIALADALRARRIAAAGIDVFETEPLPMDHPLRSCDNGLLTSHVAWFSEKSMPRLQRLAVEELVRGLRGEPLHHRVN